MTDAVLSRLLCSSCLDTKIGGPDLPGFTDRDSSLDPSGHLPGRTGAPRPAVRRVRPRCLSGCSARGCRHRLRSDARSRPDASLARWCSTATPTAWRDHPSGPLPGAAGSVGVTRAAAGHEVGGGPSTRPSGHRRPSNDAAGEPWGIDDWDHVKTKLVDTEERRTAVLDELEPTELATSIEGLSPVGAAAILADTGDLDRLTRARAVVKHAGLAPGARKSGTFTLRARVTGAGRPVPSSTQPGHTLPSTPRSPLCRDRRRGHGHPPTLDAEHLRLMCGRQRVTSTGIPR
jgi:hypothetical protein